MENLRTCAVSEISSCADTVLTSSVLGMEQGGDVSVCVCVHVCVCARARARVCVCMCVCVCVWLLRAQ